MKKRDLPAKVDGRKWNGGNNKWIITDKELYRLEELSKLSLPIDYICSLMGISKPTFYRALREDERIALTLERGRAQLGLALHAKAVKIALNAEREVTEILNTPMGQVPVQVVKKEYNEKTEADMTKFLLKAREGWREDWDGVEREDDELQSDPTPNEANLSELRERARRLNRHKPGSGS